MLFSAHRRHSKIRHFPPWRRHHQFWNEDAGTSRNMSFFSVGWGGGSQEEQEKAAVPWGGVGRASRMSQNQRLTVRQNYLLAMSGFTHCTLNWMNTSPFQFEGTVNVRCRLPMFQQSYRTFHCQQRLSTSVHYGVSGGRQIVSSLAPFLKNGAPFERTTIVPRQQGFARFLSSSGARLKEKSVGEGYNKKMKPEKKGTRKVEEDSLPSWLQEDKTPMSEKLWSGLKRLPVSVGRTLWRFLKWSFTCIRNPAHFTETMDGFRKSLRHEWEHYKTGTKLLIADVKLAANILGRVLKGYSLSRRERKQLRRTALDILRVGPLSIFVIIPGMELALPFALKIFPNMLPSTFKEELKEKEDKKRLLRARIEMTGFFQATLRDFAEETKRKARARQEQIDMRAKEREKLTDDEEGEAVTHHQDEEDKKEVKLELSRASKLMDTIDAVREGKSVDPEMIIDMARIFKDNITLDTVSRSHLVAMCKYMGLNAFGSDPYLRFQLRSAIRDIREDDRNILWEGPESLSTEELKSACEERGMRSNGLSRDEYIHQIEHWLHMSVNKNVPLTLLVMSRAFLFTSISPSQSDETAALQEAVSQLDEDVIVDAVIEAAESNPVEIDSLDAEEIAKEKKVLSELKIERLERQMELIEEEREEAAEIEQEDIEELGKDVEDEEKHGGSAPSKDLAADSDAVPRVEDLGGSAESTSVHAKGIVARPSGSRLVLSQAEIQALESLASNSAVQAERTLFEKLKMIKYEAEIADALEADSSSQQMLVIGVSSAGDNRGVAANDITASQSVASTDRDIGFSTDQDHLEVEQDEREDGEELSSTAPTSEDEGKNDDEEKHEEGDRLAAEVEKGAATMQRGQERLEAMLKRLEKDIEDADREIGSSLNLLDQNHDGICTTQEIKNVFVGVLADHDHLEADALIEALDPLGRGYVKISDLHDLLEELQDSNSKKAIFEYLGHDSNRDDE